MKFLNNGGILFIDTNQPTFPAGNFVIIYSLDTVPLKAEAVENYIVEVNYN